MFINSLDRKNYKGDNIHQNNQYLQWNLGSQWALGVKRDLETRLTSASPPL